MFQYSAICCTIEWALWDCRNESHTREGSRYKDGWEASGPPLRFAILLSATWVPGKPHHSLVLAWTPKGFDVVALLRAHHKARFMLCDHHYH